MSTAAQITANQINAQSPTGPKTPEGKAASSRNAAKFSLFSMHDFVRPGEEAEYEALSQALLQELYPQTLLQETFAVEIVRATWRLQRCARVEFEMIDTLFASGIDPMQNEAARKIQAAVDRARTQCHGIIRRSMAELRRLQTDAEIERMAAPGAVPMRVAGLASRRDIALAVNRQNKAKVIEGRIQSQTAFNKILTDFESVVSGDSAKQTQTPPLKTAA